MYKIKLLTTITVKNHSTELTGCVFEKDLQLPFIPFEGLTLQLNEEMADDFTVEDIRYCVDQDLFYLDADDVQDNTNRSEQSMREIMEHYQDHGWTLLEGETGPFIS